MVALSVHRRYVTEVCLYYSSVKKFSSHKTIPLPAFRCGRVNHLLRKRFSNPTTTLFQYWAIIPYIVVPIFLEKPALSPTYIRRPKGGNTSPISQFRHRAGMLAILPNYQISSDHEPNPHFTPNGLLGTTLT